MAEVLRSSTEITLHRRNTCIGEQESSFKNRDCPNPVHYLEVWHYLVTGGLNRKKPLFPAIVFIILGTKKNLHLLI